MKQEDLDFLSSLDAESYLSCYLSVRKLVSSVVNVAQYRTEEIPASLAAFRSLDYRDPRLYKSGLLRDVMDSYFWLLENSGKPENPQINQWTGVFLQASLSQTECLERALVSKQEKFHEAVSVLQKSRKTKVLLSIGQEELTMKKGLRYPKPHSFFLTYFIACKLLLSRAYFLFKSVWDYDKFLFHCHQLFLITLPKNKLMIIVFF
ncbi:MAG: hypothetical protein P8O16_00430 [Algoriphagus sp.]|uniref:hypothetical protein n=1 Tax=Algoriphagus sp. TaxID=1872435 RepID=UPI0026230AFF|nr:hypothetical protein [Algoriphagus sp.]MDG1275713.1 hypothetical protein [Algoriphagus sp.]